MSGYRTWGFIAWVAAVACGGNTSHNQSDNNVPEPRGSSGKQATSNGTTSSGASGATSSGAGTPSVDPGRAGNGGMAGDGTVAVGGAPSEDPCFGITPVCEPGETVCGPVTGRLTTCSACGEVLPGQGDACVRLLASDKESNNFCVVKSKSQLECWPGWGETDKSEVSGEVAELLLPDDGATQPRPIKPCLRERSGKYSCLGVGPGCKVAMGDYGACAVCDGKLQCDAQITVPDAVSTSFVDVSITDSTAFLLGNLGIETAGVPARFPSTWQGKPRKLLVDHQSAGCIASDRGELSCWLTLLEPLHPTAWSKYRKVVPTTLPRACALDDSRQLRCGDIFSDEDPAPLGPSNVVDFAASSSMVCALSITGKVSCWRFAQTIEPVEVPAGW